jgi:hypothetical protein
MKFHNSILILTITFFISVLYSMLNGSLTFGAGLGDLFYAIIHFIYLLLLIIFLTIIKYKNYIFSKSRIITLIFLYFTSISISISGFTIFRSSLYPWNGRIFMIRYEERLEIDAKKNTR